MGLLWHRGRSAVALRSHYPVQGEKGGRRDCGGPAEDSKNTEGECNMAQESDDIRPSITATRHEMAETRAALTEKLEGLEERVRDTVAGAKSTAEDMIENVKGTVDE